jgi:menaquinone-dependent protoporphyrinogen oxidase
MPRLLISYSTHDGHTAKIVHLIGDIAREVGWDPDIWPCKDLPADFSLQPYDAAVVAAPVIAGSYMNAVRNVVRRHRDALAAIPTAFVSVSWSATGQPWAPSPQQRRRANVRLFHQTGWRPNQIISVGGAVLYTRHTWLMRWLWGLFIQRTGGPRDRSRDHVYTDWEVLRRDAFDFLTTNLPGRHYAQAVGAHR